MLTQIHSRDIARIDIPSIQTGLSPEHKVRPLVEANDQVATDPFLLLMEDWFPIGVFDRHPHRGIETVTYIIWPIRHVVAFAQDVPGGNVQTGRMHEGFDMRPLQQQGKAPKLHELLDLRILG